MVLTSDGSYVVVGSTTFPYENHQDVFFVKTETLEQPPPSTATPLPPTTVPPTLEPTFAPTDSVRTSPTQTATSTISSSAPSPSIPEIPTGLTISLLIATTAILLCLRSKKLN